MEVDSETVPTSVTAAVQPAGAERVKSADRVMAVLDLVAERGGMPFSEIAERLELPKSSAHALLRTMEARGYLALDPGAKTYRLGSRIWELAQAFHEIDDLRTLMKPLMDRVVERTGETVQLASLDGASAVYLGLSESPHPMKLTSRAGARLPAYTSAIGKALLAELDPEEARRRLEGETLVKLTEHTITSVDDLLAELENVRRQGYSVDNEEFAVGLRCVAMPVRDIEGTPVAALSVSMPTPRYSREAAANARNALADATAAAAERLGRWQG
jgi:DNA-binding IclR family transcriptional regulator